MRQARFITAAWTDPEPTLPYRIERWHEAGIVEDEIKVSPVVHLDNGHLRCSSDPRWHGAFEDAICRQVARQDAANTATWTQIERNRQEYEKETALSAKSVASFQAEKAYHWLGLPIKDHRITRDNAGARAQWMAMMKGR
jgi:hypothetical protein